MLLDKTYSARRLLWRDYMISCYLQIKKWDGGWRGATDNLKLLWVFSKIWFNCENTFHKMLVIWKLNAVCSYQLFKNSWIEIWVMSIQHIILHLNKALASFFEMQLEIENTSSYNTIQTFLALCFIILLKQLWL